MPPTVTVDILDRMRPSLASLVGERAKRLRGLQYCDLRIQVKEEKGAVAENGSEKTSGEDYSFDFGVRVIAGGRPQRVRLLWPHPLSGGCQQHR